MKISKTHQRLADDLNRLHNLQGALDHPKYYLGSNWKDVINFWLFLDTLTVAQLCIINHRYFALDQDDSAILLSVWDTYTECEKFYYQVAYEAVCAVSKPASLFWIPSAKAKATIEIMVRDDLLNSKKSLVFLPLFINI
jgi:hypothetical protein